MESEDLVELQDLLRRPRWPFSPLILAENLEEDRKKGGSWGFRGVTEKPINIQGLGGGRSKFFTR